MLHEFIKSEYVAVSGLVMRLQNATMCRTLALSRASVWFVYSKPWKRTSLINLTRAHSNKNTNIWLTLDNFKLMKTLLWRWMYYFSAEKFSFMVQTFKWFKEKCEQKMYVSFHEINYNLHVYTHMAQTVQWPLFCYSYSQHVILLWTPTIQVQAWHLCHYQCRGILVLVIHLEKVATQCVCPIKNFFSNKETWWLPCLQ